jgi:hypothetical protein
MQNVTHFEIPGPLRMVLQGPQDQFVVRGTGIRAYESPSVEASLTDFQELVRFVRSTPNPVVQIFRGPFVVASFPFSVLRPPTGAPMFGNLEAAAIGSTRDLDGKAIAVAILVDPEGLCSIGYHG